MDQNALPAKLEVVGTRRDPITVSQIKSTIQACTTNLGHISSEMSRIQAQGGWERFWNKGENIATIAKYADMSARVQRTSLDLMVLLMGAAGVMKQDYNTIIESIQELKQSHSGNVEVLDYLVRLKNAIAELKRREDALDSLVTFTNDLRDSIDKSIENLGNDIDNAKAEVDCVSNKEASLESLFRGMEEKMAAISTRQEELFTAVEELRLRGSVGERIVRWVKRLGSRKTPEISA